MPILTTALAREEPADARLTLSRFYGNTQGPKGFAMTAGILPLKNRHAAGGVTPPVGDVSAAADRTPGVPSSDECYAGSSLEGLPTTWIDWLLPRRPRQFFWVVLLVAVGVWLLGLALATDHDAFLLSQEWQIQPLFLAGHIVALRLFVSCYARNYLRGIRFLNLPDSAAERWTLNVLRPAGGIIALVIAAPFCFYDLIALKEYCLVPEQGIGAVDVLQGIVWCVEWALNAYIWTILVGFAGLLSWTIRKHDFRSSMQTVIQLKQYRPFLLMSVQGSTILVFFSAVYALYVWYADGEASDFAGLAITLLLLFGCFVPPWLLLRNKLEAEVKQQLEALALQLLETQAEVAKHTSDGTAMLVHRLDEANSMLRITYLERLLQELGRAEGRAVIMRILVPVSTVLMKVLRPLLLGL